MINIFINETITYNCIRFQIFVAGLHINYFLVLNRINGVCSGEFFHAQRSSCTDLDSKNPVCIECQEICNSHVECSGFFVKLHDGNCFFLKGSLTIHDNKDILCYQKRK